MQIIRDTNLIMMIPLLNNFGIERCNVENCREYPDTIITDNGLIFGLCESHYQEAKGEGEVSFTLIFDNRDKVLSGGNKNGSKRKWNKKAV